MFYTSRKQCLNSFPTFANKFAVNFRMRKTLLLSYYNLYCFAAAIYSDVDNFKPKTILFQVNTYMLEVPGAVDGEYQTAYIVI